MIVTSLPGKKLCEQPIELLVDGGMGSVEDATPLLPGQQDLPSGRGKSWTAAQSDILRRIRVAAANPTHKTYLWVGIGAGLVCGLVAFVYSTAFQSLLDLVWVRAGVPRPPADVSCDAPQDGAVRSSLHARAGSHSRAPRASGLV